MIVPQSSEVPSGIYMIEKVELPDRLWEQTMKEIKSLLADMKEYEV